MGTEGGSIPQVLAIVPCTADGRVGLTKGLRAYLGLTAGQSLEMSTTPEVVIRAGERKEEALGPDAKGRLRLPAQVLETLEISATSQVAFVERPPGLALKSLEVVERPGAWASLTDIETPCRVVRVISTSPPPEELRAALVAQHRGARLRHDVRAYLQGRPSFEAWQARRILGETGAAGKAQRQLLAEQRIAEQQESGSWRGQVALTARCLRELAELGLPRTDPRLRRGAEWLLARPESEHNAGMFFGADRLVQEQASVVEQRRHGGRARFRQIRASEQNLVRAGDAVIQRPCGPRIMWPNALALEALLCLGYEGEPRVQRALAAMRTDWCECTYQEGSRPSQAFTSDWLEDYEAGCLREFRYGGIGGPGPRGWVDARWVPSGYPRTAHRVTAEGDEYRLEMPRHLAGCAVITTRALSDVADPQMKRFAEAHLWRFASRQRPDGRFAPEKYGSGLSPAGFLDVFGRFQHPASKVVALRAIPWIIESQNEDGSWGEGEGKEADTRAIVSVLASVRDDVDALAAR